MRFVKISFLVLLLYLFLHNFPLDIIGIGIGTKNLLYIVLLWTIFKKRRKYLQLLHSFKTELWILILPLIYVLFWTLFGGESSVLTKHVIALLDVFFVPLALVLISFEMGLTEESNYFRNFLLLGAVASIISFVCFLVPGLQTFIKSSILRLDQDDYLFWTEFRGFGLSDSLTSNYAYVQATIFVLGCIYAKHNKWFLFFLPLVFFSVLFNARTGIVIILVGLVIYFFSSKKILYSVGIGVFAILILKELPDIMSSMGIGSDGIRWVTIIFEDIYNVLLSQDIGQSRTGEELFDSMWILPDNTEEWLFGKGYTLFRHSVYKSSDVGWILQLNYGGIFYMILLYLIMIRVCFSLVKCGRFRYALYFLSIFLIVNTKSVFVPNCEEFRLLMFAYFYYVLTSKTRKQVHLKPY